MCKSVQAAVERRSRYNNAIIVSPLIPAGCFYFIIHPDKHLGKASKVCNKNLELFNWTFKKYFFVSNLFITWYL